MKILSSVFVLLLVYEISVSQTTGADVTANDFIQSLSDQQRSKTLYTIENEERFNWHYFPKSDRKGIALYELNEGQKAKALSLLKQCLSSTGFQKTTDVVALENVLRIIENRNSDEYRNAGKYYITVFGKPDQKKAWGWRFEGHHISFNFSSLNNQLISGTPGFLGANPAIVKTGPEKGKEPLREETEQAFALLHSFTPAQIETALSKSPPPNDILTFVSRKASIESGEGIQYSAMTKPQQELFLKLIGIYIHRYTKLFADDMMKELNSAGLDNLRFTWAGAKEKADQPYYYRIQGPTIIIEYDNTQGNANHIHTVVRDLKNDFGGDQLLEHYKKDHVVK